MHLFDTIDKMKFFNLFLILLFFSCSKPELDEQLILKNGTWKFRYKQNEFLNDRNLLNLETLGIMYFKENGIGIRDLIYMQEPFTWTYLKSENKMKIKINNQETIFFINKVAKNKQYWTYKEVQDSFILEKIYEMQKYDME